MRSLLIIVFLLITLSLSAQKIFTAQQLQADFAVLRKSYETLHPGLYKYDDKATIDGYFAACQRALSRDQSLSEAYLAVMKLTAQFKCGHSYPNFFNQGSEVKALFEQKNSLPFWFRLVENRMLVTKSIDPNVPAGAVIETINNVPVSQIIQTMLPLVRADGSNDGKRRNLLEINGSYFTYFDVLLPLLFPVKKPGYVLTISGLLGNKKPVTVNSVLHSERDKQIKKMYPITESTATFSWVDGETARLQINSLASWDKPFNFGKFYDAAVTEFNQKKGRNLIIDLRTCEGGDLWNGKQLIRHLTTKPITINEQQDAWAYVSMDSSLSQYILNEWGYSNRYRNADDFVKLPSGLFRSKKAGVGQRLDPGLNHLTGRIFLLTSATNSSAAWQMATVFREHNLATLVGQETGGNQKGITAGSLFFMRLPNTGIEVDVPLIGMDYTEAASRPNTGLKPDVLVVPTLAAARQSIDQEMAAVQKLIAAGK